MSYYVYKTNEDLFPFIISVQAGKVKLKNVSWAIAGLTLKTSNGKFYNHTLTNIYAFNFSFAKPTNKQLDVPIGAPIHTNKQVRRCAQGTDIYVPIYRNSL